MSNKLSDIYSYIIGGFRGDDIFTLDEKKIGKWVNGKDLYRKVILSRSQATPSTVEPIEDIPELNIDDIISFDMTMKGQGFIAPVPMVLYTPNVPYAQIDVYYDNSTKQIMCNLGEHSHYADIPLIITLIYTKIS